jgi:hypothetical protein
MAAKTYVLSSGSGPIAAGDLDALKARAEKSITGITGDNEYKWEKVEESEDEPSTRLGLHRRNRTSGRWIYVKNFIDEVPVVADKKKAGA